MYQNQKANIFVLSMVAVLAISLATPVAQADLDIRGIYISSSKDHLDGTPITDPWVFEIWMDFIDSGTLHHIDVTPPSGGSGPFTIYEDSGHWEHESPTDYSTLGALQGDYPTGNYTFEFENIGNVVLNTVPLDNSGISESLNAVGFTYPSYNGQTDISINPTFTWTIGSSDGDALGMWLWDPVTMNDLYEDVPALMTKTSWTPGSLAPNHNYDLEVSVFRLKGGAVGTTSVGGDEFDYYLMNEYLNEIKFTTTPVPGAVFLGAIGISMVGWLCRHKEQ